MKKIAIALAALAIVFACDKEKGQPAEETPGGGGGGQGGGGGEQTEWACTTLDAVDITYESARLVGKATIPEGKRIWDDYDIAFLFSTNEEFPLTGFGEGVMEMAVDEIAEDGTFVSPPIPILEPNTTYYFRAVLYVKDQPFDGGIKSFTTLKQPRALVETGEATEVTEVSATLVGYANPTQDMQNVSFGVVLSQDRYMDVYPVAFTASERDPEDGLFTVDIEELEPGKTYYFKAFVGHDSMRSDGDIHSFTTPAINASVAATGATEVSEFAVTLNGKLTMDTVKDFEPEVWFLLNRYDGNGEQSIPCEMAPDSTFSYRRTELEINRDYEYRACARLGGKEFRSEAVNFSTTAINGQLEALPVSDITELKATLNASFTTECSSSIERKVIFYWSDHNKDEQGHYVDLNEIGTPVTATKIGNNTYEAHLTGLEPDKDYYFAVEASIMGYKYLAFGEFRTLDFTASVETLEPSVITGTGATLQGRLTVSSVEDLTKQAWYMFGDQRYEATIASDGTFSAEVTGLRNNRPYSYTAYAKVYDRDLQGQSVSFRTKSTEVHFTSITLSDVLEYTATVSGIVSIENSDASDTPKIQFFSSPTETTVEGILDSYYDPKGSANPASDGTFSIGVSRLQYGTENHCVLSCQLGGRRYDSDVFSITTLSLGATFSDLRAVNITETTATLEGRVEIQCREGLETEVKVGWSNRSFAGWNPDQNQTVTLSSDGSFSLPISYLSPGKDYYFAVMAWIDLNNTWFTSEVATFHTPEIRATVTTLDATSVQYTRAVLHGSGSVVTEDDPNYKFKFIYGKKGVPESQWESIYAVLQDDGTYSAAPFVEPGSAYQYKFALDILRTTVTGEAHSFTTLTPPASNPPSGAVSLKTFATRDDGTQYEIYWSDRNVGASSPETPGLFVSWGELDEKSSYFTSNYRWRGTKPSTEPNYNEWKVSKYCPSSAASYWANADTDVPDNKLVLDPEDDLATVLLGGGWRTPTPAEWTALETHCTFAGTTLNGMAGVEVTSKLNGNTLFFPACGYRQGTSSSNWQTSMDSYGERACYWASEVDINEPTIATSASFDISSTVFRNWLPRPFRYMGLNVRAVTE